MRNVFWMAGLLAAVSFGTTGARATTLTFDDLTSEANISTAYNGLIFSNMAVKLKSLSFPSGYVNGTVSGNSSIYNNLGLGASFSATNFGTFTLNDFYLTAAVNNGLEVDVTGSLGGNTLYSKTFFVSTTSPTLELVDWAGIDTVSFSSSGGTLDPTAGLHYVTGAQFVIDNVRINEALTPVGAVPEPGTLALLGTGLASLAAMRRRFLA